MKNQKNGEIIVSVLSSSKTFASYKELESFVDSLPNIYGPLEYAALRTLASLKLGGASHVREIAPDPPEPTPFDDRIAVLDQEEEGAETVYEESKEAWLSRLQELEADAPRRFHKAQGNPTKFSRFQIWLEERNDEVRNLDRAFAKADRKLRRSRARANALKDARARWRQEQTIRVIFEGEAVTLAEFEQLRKHEVR